MVSSNLQRKWFILLNTSIPHSITEGSQGRNLESETKAETVEQCCLLACSLWLLQPVSSTIQDHIPRGGTTHRGLNLPIPNNSQEKALSGGFLFPCDSKHVPRWQCNYHIAKSRGLEFRSQHPSAILASRTHLSITQALKKHGDTSIAVTFSLPAWTKTWKGKTLPQRNRQKATGHLMLSFSFCTYTQGKHTYTRTHMYKFIHRHTCACTNK